MTIVILGGFLGSGKTTLLNSILTEYMKGSAEAKFAILINEFGDIPVDTLLVNRGDLLVREVTGGCICCSLKGRLQDAAAEIARIEEPDILFIEATGIAVPSEIARTLSSSEDPPLLEQARIETLLCLDAVQYRRFSSSLMLFQRQLESASLVYLTKSDILDSGLLASVRAEIEASDSGKGIRIISGMEELLLLLSADHGPSAGQNTIYEDQDASGEIFQETFPFNGPVKRSEIEVLCARAAGRAGAGLLRLKGVVETEDGWFALQYADGTLELTPCEAAPGRAGLVVISARNDR